MSGSDGILLTLTNDVHKELLGLSSNEKAVELANIISEHIGLKAEAAAKK